MFHVHYGETILKVADGLPKFKDLPKDIGGPEKLWKNNFNPTDQKFLTST